MNDPKTKKGSAGESALDPQRLSAVTEAVSQAHGIGIEAGALEEGQGMDGPPSPDSRPALLDPEACRKIARKALGMVERAAGRDLYSTALRATGGDKGFASEVVQGWGWTDDEMDEVSDLVFETAKLYGASKFFRPDIALLISAGTHAAGFLIVKRSIMERVRETSELERMSRIQAEKEKAAKEKSAE